MSLDVYLETTETDEVYSANITHNLNIMAQEAGIYKELWRPDEIGITKASQLVEPLIKGLSALLTDRKRFEEFNPSNGWGEYKDLVRFVVDYIMACTNNPDATIRISR